MPKTETYFVIHTSCDGAYLKEMDRETLLDNLDNEAWGEDLQAFSKEGGKIRADLTADTGFLIIKGMAVKPKAVEKIVKHEVD